MRTKPRVTRLLGLVFVLGSAVAQADAPDKTLRSLLLDNVRVTSPVVSPDAQAIAYLVRTPRNDTDDPGPGRWSAWVLTEGQELPKQYTRSDDGTISQLRFTPDSSRLTFVSRRSDNAQVYALPLDGGEASPLTDLDGGVFSYALSPDGERIAVITRAPEDEERAEQRGRGFDMDVVDAHFEHRVVHIIHLGTGAQKRVSPLNRTAYELAWSPDGRRLAVMWADSPRSDDNYMFRSLYVVPTDGDDDPTLLVKEMGKMIRPRWSPDGEQIAFLGASVPSDATTGTLWLVHADTKERRALNPAAIETVYDFHWDSDDALLVSAVSGTRSHLSRRTLAGVYALLLENGPIFLNFSTDRERKRLVFAGSTPQHPSEIFSMERDQPPNMRSQHHAAWREQTLATQTSIAWQTSDDLRIEGVYLRPANAPSGEALPLVIVAHGGPEWQSLDGWTTHPLSPVQLLVARGYAVLLPNYRGSAGRGGQFAMADQGDLGGREFQDVLEGIDHLAARGDVDPKRVALLGGSYGGYFAGLAATRHSGRFAAAISFAGISDWGSFTGTSDIPQENSLVHWGLHCYDSRENAERCRAGSPMAYLDGAQTPLLLLHGAEDHRVPLSQAQQLYIAFRHKNVPVELVIYPREGHGIAERAHQQDTIDRILDWLRAHLEPGPADRS